MSYRIKVWIAGVCTALICVLLCWLSHLYQIGEYIGIFGSVASVFGVFLAYSQIKSVKIIAEETKLELDNKISGINNYLTLADMSRIISLAKEAKSYLTSSKLEMAAIRLSDLKLDLVLLRQNDRFLTNDELPELTSVINDIGIDIVNISSNVKKKENLSADVIVNHLENALTLLAGMEGRLKYKEL